MESGSLLGEGESFFVEHVAAARFLLLQWMAPHATTLGREYVRERLVSEM